MSGNRSIGHDARGGHLARAREALDHPTGPATRGGKAAPFDERHEVRRMTADDKLLHFTRDEFAGCLDEAEEAGAAAAKARILAALPEALERAGIPLGYTTVLSREIPGIREEQAADLAAAIEKTLEDKE